MLNKTRRKLGDWRSVAGTAKRKRLREILDDPVFQEASEIVEASSAGPPSGLLCNYMPGQDTEDLERAFVFRQTVAYGLSRAFDLLDNLAQADQPDGGEFSEPDTAPGRRLKAFKPEKPV